MKSRLFTHLFFVSLLALHGQSGAESSPMVTFVNGEIADADDINSNFDNHEQRLKAIEQYGGCSATQDGSSVIISCIDGTSGVLAGAGTVVALSSGVLGDSVDISTFQTGEIFLLDANDVPLAKLRSDSISGPVFKVLVEGRYDAKIINDQTLEKVLIQPANRASAIEIGYVSDDCSGEPLALSPRTSPRQLFYHPDKYLAVIGAEVGQQIIRSKHDVYKIWPDELEVSGCSPVEVLKLAAVLVSYQPAREILEAAYPVKVGRAP